MSVARWIQCEEAISRFGFLAKHPTTGNAIASPYVHEPRLRESRSMRTGFQIYQIVRENCSVEYDGSSPQDDLMEAVARARNRKLKKKWRYGHEKHIRQQKAYAQDIPTSCGLHRRQRIGPAFTKKTSPPRVACEVMAAGRRIIVRVRSPGKSPCIITPSAGHWKPGTIPMDFSSMCLSKAEPRYRGRRGYEHRSKERRYLLL